jgi:hypothetical protein
LSAPLKLQDPLRVRLLAVVHLLEQAETTAQIKVRLAQPTMSQMSHTTARSLQAEEAERRAARLRDGVVVSNLKRQCACPGGGVSGADAPTCTIS